MKAKYLFTLIVFILLGHSSFSAVKLFFFKAYSDDFKKSSTLNFFGGDPIYGLINVTTISVNDNTITSLDEFADSQGAVRIRLYFPDLDQEVSWRMTLVSGRIKNNQFLFCLMPESAGKLDKDYMEVLKVFNQLKGKKFTMNVRAGEKDVTAWWEQDLTIDLTNGMGVYGDWYAPSVPASVQNTTTFYKICSQGQLYVDFDYPDQITVQIFTTDSIRFISKGSTYRAVRPDGFNFLNGTSKSTSFYAYRVDAQSFILRQGSEGCNFYSTNKNLASEPGANNRCSFEAYAGLNQERKRFNELEAEKYNKQKEIGEKLSRENLTKYVHNFVSKRSDAVFEKKILQWWNTRYPAFPATKVYFVDYDFFLVRDEFNQVLRKLVGAMVVYKNKEGGCLMQWNAFGYEHLGGGAFAQELTAWVAGNKARGNYIIEVNGREIYAGTNYFLDCDGLK